MPAKPAGRGLGPTIRRPVDGLHRPPADCPVCGDRLAVTRLGCASCGSEVGGVFAPCAFCALDDEEVELLRVFLVSRGNLREVEKHLGVSYPTARARFTALLEHLGLAPVSAAEPGSSESGDPELGNPELGNSASSARDRILADVAAGRLSPTDAERLLTRS